VIDDHMEVAHVAVDSDSGGLSTRVVHVGHAVSPVLRRCEPS
jgi:hypothetical protein